MSDLNALLSNAGVLPDRLSDMGETEKRELWETLKPLAEHLAMQRKLHPVKFASLTKKQSKFVHGIRPGVKVACAPGANRSGKTETGAFLATAWLMGKDYFRGSHVWEEVKDLPIPIGKDRTVWASSLNFDMARDITWPKLRKMLPREEGILHWSERDRIIRYVDAEGYINQIVGKSVDSGWEKYQGASCDLIWEDEEHPEKIHDECYQRTIDCRGILIVTCTPLGDETESSAGQLNWLPNLYEQWLLGDPTLFFETYSIYDNPHLPQDEVEKAVKRWKGHAEEPARIWGKFIRRMGLCYGELETQHFVDPFKIPKDWMRIRVIDPHPSKPTACIWAAVDHFDNVYVYREYYERGIASDHAKQICATSQINNEAIDRTIIDPHGSAQVSPESGKTIAAIYRENGLYTIAGCDDVNYRIATVNEYLRATKDTNSPKPKLYFFNTLTELRKQISKYKWSIFRAGEKRGQAKGTPLEVDDDFPDCLGYLCAFRPRARKYSTNPTPISASYT
jgi:phage terminase large subunit-like protein